MSAQEPGHKIEAARVEIKVWGTDGRRYELVAPAPDVTDPSPIDVVLRLDSVQAREFGLCELGLTRAYVIAMSVPAFDTRWNMQVTGADDSVGEVSG